MIAVSRSRPWVLGLLALAILLLWDAPWVFVAPDVGLDPSWKLVLSRASLAGKQWGRDVVFTYGPLVDLATHLLVPERLFLLAGVQTLLLAVLLWATAVLLRAATAWYVLATIFCMAFSFGLVQDTQFYLYPIVFALLVYSRQGSNALKLTLCAVMGLICLVKSSYAVLSIFILLLADFDRVMVRKWPHYTPVFLFVFFSTYLGLGQSFQEFPQYCEAALEIISGYTEAMSNAPNNFGPLLLISLLLLLNLTRIAILENQAQKDSPQLRRRMFFITSWLAFAFIVYKAGFVRYDWAHWPTTVMSLAIFMLLYLPTSAMQYVSRRALKLNFTCTVLVFVICLPSMFNAQPPLFVTHLKESPAQALRETKTLLASPSRWALERRHDYDAALLDIRQQAPLPALQGTIDSISSRQSSVIANGLQYHARPVIQEYSTYTPELLKRNADFFSGADAPDHLILSHRSIDNRWPSSPESSSWPILLSRYQTNFVSSDFIILQRRPQPLPVRLQSLQKGTLKFNETLVLPEYRQALMLRLAAERSTFGKLVSLLFQPSALFIEATLSDGQNVRSRLIPAIASSGFVITPYIKDSTDLGTLFDVASPPDVGRAVKSIRFVASASYRGEQQFKPSLRFELLAIEQSVKPVAMTTPKTVSTP